MERGYIYIAHGAHEDAMDEVDVSSRGRRNQAGNNKALPCYNTGRRGRKRGKRRRVYYVFVRRSFSFLRNEYSFVTRSTLSQRLDNESLRDDGERKKQKKKKGVETRVCGGRDREREKERGDWEMFQKE